MLPALPIRWLDGSRARSRRVAQAICVLWILSLADLVFTLWAHVFTPFHELNPLAKALLDGDQVAVLVLLKLILTTVGATIFWRLRDHARAEVGLWVVVTAYVLLALRWSSYTVGVMALAAPVT
jgi:hypothetical protein